MESTILMDEQWSDEEQDELPMEAEEEAGVEAAGESGDGEDERYGIGDDDEDDADDEETQQQGRVELPPSRSGRTRWANPRYQ